MKITASKWPKPARQTAIQAAGSRDGRARDERLADLLRLSKPGGRPPAS